MALVRRYGPPLFNGAYRSAGTLKDPFPNVNDAGTLYQLAALCEWSLSANAVEFPIPHFIPESEQAHAIWHPYQI
jgi:hypothetical protein